MCVYPDGGGPLSQVRAQYDRKVARLREILGPPATLARDDDAILCVCCSRGGLMTVHGTDVHLPATHTGPTGRC